MLSKLKDFISRLTTPELILIVGVLAVGYFAVGYGSSRATAYIQKKQFEKERAANLKDVQTALAKADASDAKAAAKEKTAAQSGEVIGQKAAVASSRQADLERQDAQNMSQIEQQYQAAKDRINSDAPDSERLKDACASAERLGLQLDSCQPGD
jgi:hypothetical protein